VRTLGNLARAMAGQQNQFETVVYFIDAIFYGDTGHCLSFAVFMSRINRPDTGIGRRIQVFPDRDLFTSMRQPAFLYVRLNFTHNSMQGDWTAD
jgi:hypothetical protein